MFNWEIYIFGSHFGQRDIYIPDVLVLPGGISPEGPATALPVGFCNRVNQLLDP